MAILEILTVPHPLLTKKCRPVEPDDFGPSLRKLVSDMAETMYAAPGVGLAAPQVGDLRRIIVADPGNSRKEEDKSGRPKKPRFVAMINPMVVEASKERMVYEEGCLSVPEFYTDILRPRRALIRWLDEEGKPQQQWFEGYDAMVIQHEMDHLEGTVILDRVSGFKKNRYLQKQKKVAASAELYNGA